MRSRTTGSELLTQFLTCSLLLFTVFIAPAAAVPRDFSWVFRRQSSTFKTELGPQLSRGVSAIIEPSDVAFIAAKSRWSDYGAPGVSVVVNVSSEQDIVRTIQYCNQKGKKFLIQNSGHGWSTMDNLQDLVIIRVDSMNKIVIDTNANTVIVGPGVDMGQLITALHAVQRQTTLGTCDCPGVIGAMLGGGHGRLQGKYGLLLDQMLSARVILHNGTIVTTSASQNIDLFWALRGAGHNFGVVTEASIKIYPADNGGNHYNAVTFYEDYQLESIFGAMNNITLPERSSAYVMFFSEQNGRQFIAIDFTYAGRPEDGKALLTSIFDVRLPQFTTRQELVLPWSELNKRGMLGIAQAWCVRGWRKNTFSTGISYYNLADVRNVWNSYRQLIAQNPSAFQSMFIWETYPMQGMRNRDSALTAYANRDVNHIVVAFLIYEQANMDATMNAYGTNTFRNTLNSHNGFQNGMSKVYLNYGHGLEKPAEFYGWESWRQQKLVALKKSYDPLGRFNAYHPIPTTVAGFT